MCSMYERNVFILFTKIRVLLICVSAKLSPAARPRNVNLQCEMHSFRQCQCVRSWAVTHLPPRPSASAAPLCPFSVSPSCPRAPSPGRWIPVHTDPTGSVFEDGEATGHRRDSSGLPHQHWLIRLPPVWSWRCYCDCLSEPGLSFIPREPQQTLF